MHTQIEEMGRAGDAWIVIADHHFAAPAQRCFFLPDTQGPQRLSLQALGARQGEAALRRRGEMVIRNYDPCISCATHFLDLRVRELTHA